MAAINFAFVLVSPCFSSLLALVCSWHEKQLYCFNLFANDDQCKYGHHVLIISTSRFVNDSHIEPNIFVHPFLWYSEKNHLYKL